MGLVQTIQALINGQYLRSIVLTHIHLPPGENHAAHPPQTQPAVKTRPQPRLRVGPQRVPSPPNIDFGPWNIPIDNVCDTTPVVSNPVLKVILQPRLWSWTVNRDTSIFQNSVRDRPALPVTRDYQMARVIDAQVLLLISCGLLSAYKVSRFPPLPCQTKGQGQLQVNGS